MKATNPAGMTSEERIQEVAVILIQGIKRQQNVNTSSIQNGKITPPPREKPLAFPPNKSVHVSHSTNGEKHGSTNY